jgi:hypothetical protein
MLKEVGGMVEEGGTPKDRVLREKWDTLFRAWGFDIFPLMKWRDRLGPADLFSALGSLGAD